MNKMIIYAPNVHVGGGAILLKEIIRTSPKDINIVFILDERFRTQNNTDFNFEFVYFPSSFSGRLKAEIYLKNISTSQDHIVCLHNIPPVLNPLGKITVFLQNRLIVDINSRDGCSYKAKLKLNIESLLVKMGYRRKASYIVQTESMEQRLRGLLKSENASITVLPFSGTSVTPMSRGSDVKSIYIYIASAEPHKNHSNLLAAWKIIAQKYNQKPKLLLTLPNSSTDLNRKIKECIEKYGLNILNLGTLEHTEILNYLSNSKALIYPSKTESFGLPLVEAMSLNVPIIASELDYVRDISKPIETFDPNSPLSIARAVARYEGYEKGPSNVCETSYFWQSILQ